MTRHIKFQWWPDMWIIGIVWDAELKTIAAGLGPVNVQWHLRR